MKLAQYLESLNGFALDAKQTAWNKQLEERKRSFQNSSSRPTILYQEFERRVRTEELKAWYSTPDTGDVLQGTSVSSLVIPSVFEKPLNLKDVRHLEEVIADQYIAIHKEYAQKVQDAIIEPIDGWIKEGLFYGIVIPSKVISQAFNLVINTDDLVETVNGAKVDPHQINKHHLKIKEEYFNKLERKIDCFQGLDLARSELEASLVLADCSKPHMERYRDKAILGPVRCNEIAALLAKNVKNLIIEKSKNIIVPRSLEVIIFDTDTPYTFHKIMGHNGNQDAPCLPGLTVLGASGTIDSFRWLYAYRVSLIAQKMMKGSLYSQAKASFIPFIFFGVLIPRDAEILIDLNQLDILRYPGNLSADKEFAYLANELLSYLNADMNISKNKNS